MTHPSNFKSSHSPYLYYICVANELIIFSQKRWLPLSLVLPLSVPGNSNTCPKPQPHRKRCPSPFQLFASGFYFWNTFPPCSVPFVFNSTVTVQILPYGHGHAFYILPSGFPYPQSSLESASPLVSLKNNSNHDSPMFSSFSSSEGIQRLKPKHRQIP